ncbi:unnamed protein product [Rotaria socialis]
MFVHQDFFHFSITILLWNVELNVLSFAFKAGCFMVFSTMMTFNNTVFVLLLVSIHLCRINDLLLQIYHCLEYFYIHLVKVSQREYVVNVSYELISK